jgi:hypothetical protein
VDAVLLKALSKKPEQRYENVAAFLAAMREACATPGAPGSEPETPAVGVHLQVDFAPELAETDEAAMAAGDLLDSATELLTEEGFTLPLQTANSLLAVRPAEVVPASLKALATQLYALGDTSLIPLRVSLCVHLAPVRLNDQQQAVGGPLMDFASWRPADVQAIHFTSAAAALG